MMLGAGTHTCYCLFFLHYRIANQLSTTVLRAVLNCLEVFSSFPKALKVEFPKLLVRLQTFSCGFELIYHFKRCIALFCHLMIGKLDEGGNLVLMHKMNRKHYNFL